MHVTYDIIIAGAGAAGMMAAISAGRLLESGKIVILEKEKRPGRKLLATGNGRCNLTNINADPDDYFGDEPRFARGPLHRFSTAAVLSFFSELGLKTRVDDQGRVYPWCNQSAAVLDVLRLELHRLGIEIITEQGVTSVDQVGSLFIGDKPLNREPEFEVKTANGKIYRARKVIMATGGLAAPALGADSSGLEIAEKLGHDLRKTMPALVPLELDSHISKKLSGIRFEAVASILQNESEVMRARGEFLWTDYGVSGIAAMEVSRAVSAYDGSSTILFDLLPDMSNEEIVSWIKTRIAQHPDLIVDSLLTGLFHRRMGEELIKHSISNSVIPTLEAVRLKTEHIVKIADCLKSLKIKVIGTRSWDQAQITVGGLDVRNFRPDSMQSRICEGLFAAGEVLDIDGPCGGFNLQWAWSSGWLAGFKAAGDLLKQEVSG